MDTCPEFKSSQSFPVKRGDHKSHLSNFKVSEGSSCTKNDFLLKNCEAKIYFFVLINNPSVYRADFAVSSCDI
jgi:hypothetical protein